MLACGLLLGACGGDDNPGSTGGSGGSAGNGGRGGGGGSGGTGGSAGTGGAAGTGGSAGTGGAAGTGGQGGSGGSDARSPDSRPADRAGGDAGRRDGGTNADTGSAATFPGAHPLCPNCKSIFNGKDLQGWTARGEVYAVQDGSILSTGQSRGVLVSSGSYEKFRLVFNYKLLGGGHKANLIVFCQTPTSGNTCGGVQFQPPGGDLWDYRPGAPAGGRLDPPKETGRGANVPDGQWGQCGDPR